MSVLLTPDAGWVPQQAGSETEICMQEFFWGVSLRSNLWRSGRRRIEQKEKSNCNTVATKASVGPLEISGAGAGTSELSDIKGR